MKKWDGGECKMKCRDCIHYQAHKHFYKPRDFERDFDDDFDDVDVEIKCPEFKSKSKFVELPCNVEDTVYIVEDGEMAEHKVLSVDIGFLGFRVYTHCPIQCDIDDPCCANINICRTSYGQHEFNDKIFFSKEKAERALKEENENDE